MQDAERLIRPSPFQQGLGKVFCGCPWLKIHHQVAVGALDSPERRPPLRPVLEVQVRGI